MAADVHYLPSGGARAAAVVAADAAFSCLVADRIELVADVEPYRPGKFWLRELPALRAVLGGLAGMVPCWKVIDGYADLDPDGRPGLGARAHVEARRARDRRGQDQPSAPPPHAVPVRRGTTRPPAVCHGEPGCPAPRPPASSSAWAAQYRLPDALRRADTLARHGLSQAPRC